VLDLLASDPASLSSIRDPADGWRVHVADSLSGLELITAARTRSRDSRQAVSGMPTMR